LLFRCATRCHRCYRCLMPPSSLPSSSYPVAHRAVAIIFNFVSHRAVAIDVRCRPPPLSLPSSSYPVARRVVAIVVAVVVISVVIVLLLVPVHIGIHRPQLVDCHLSLPCTSPLHSPPRIHPLHLRSLSHSRLSHSLFSSSAFFLAASSSSFIVPSFRSLSRSTLPRSLS
jgi:hypothetical protein